MYTFLRQILIFLLRISFFNAKEIAYKFETRCLNMDTHWKINTKCLQKVVFISIFENCFPTTKHIP